MASGEADIEMAVETFTPRNFDDRSSTQDSTKSEDEDKDKEASIGDRNDVHKSDRKIGHRRVGVGGQITYKKIVTTQIMGSIQLGIQHAVGGLASKPERDLLMQDFMTVETTNFPSEGSNHTPAHHYSEFRFRTYAPIAFRYFRDLFGIQPDDFLMSMCSSPLRELSNPGASGSIFYLTDDDEFIIKTVQHKEGEFLQKLLPGYYMNLNQNPRTLLPKFFGLFCYQCNSKNVRLVAMNNLLPSVVKLHQKYDLKGSTYKRKASKSEHNKKSPTYKDLDFMEHHPHGLFLEADTYGALVKTIQRDCRVLESFKIMDYSLLVGVHNLDRAQREKAEERMAEGRAEEEGGGAGGERSMLTRTRSEQKTKEDFTNQVRRTQSINRQRLVAHSTAMESIQAESEPIDEEEDVPPGGIPARNGKGERLLLYVGVIDILQSYRFRKKLEHTWKSMIHDGDTVSVHRPSFYAQRFQDFMAKKVFTKIPSPLKHSPSKRKSISRPLRPHEDPDSGAGTSVQPSTEESQQFPRVLWVEPVKPRNLPDSPDEAFLSPEYPRRRFSSDTDSSMSSRVPSPYSYSDVFKTRLKSIEGSNDGLKISDEPKTESDEDTLDKYNRSDVTDGKFDTREDDSVFGADESLDYRHNTSTPKNPKVGMRKISFAVDGKEDLRSRSNLSSHSSIAEAMKDMPYMDNVEEPRQAKEELLVKKIEDIVKKSETDGNKAKSKPKRGFFGGLKKAFVEFFGGTDEEEEAAANVDDAPKKDIAKPKHNPGRTKDYVGTVEQDTDKIINDVGKAMDDVWTKRDVERPEHDVWATRGSEGIPLHDVGTAKHTVEVAVNNGPKYTDDVLYTRDSVKSKNDVEIRLVNSEGREVSVEMDKPDINSQIKEVSKELEEEEEFVIVEYRNEVVETREDMNMFEGECSNDDFAVIPYKENRINIMDDIEACTDFAESDELEPNLEVSWKNRRLTSKSLREADTSKSEGGDRTITETYTYNSLRMERRNRDENTTSKFLESERARNNESENFNKH